MRSKGDLREGAEIVDPVETGLVRRGVVARNEEINRVRVPRPKRVRERAANPGSCSSRTERVGVADLVEGDVALDELCELESVA